MRVSTGTTIGVMAAVALGASALLAMGPGSPVKGKKVTLQGRVVDIHNFITEGYASADRVRTTREALEHGIPGALETPDGLVLLGSGAQRDMMTKIRSFPYAEVEAQGMLFEKHGVKYLDISAISVPTPATHQEDDEGDGYSDWDDDQ